MKKRAILVLVAAVVVLLAVVYAWGPSRLPGGQQPLVTLSQANWSAFAAAFDADPSVPRVLLLLSPT